MSKKQKNKGKIITFHVPERLMFLIDMIERERKRLKITRSRFILDRIRGYFSVFDIFDKLR